MTEPGWFEVQGIMNIAQRIKEILSEYDLGDLVAFEKNERGFVNTSFAIDTIQEGQPRRLFFRQYKREISEEELLFEHSLIDHLRERGYPPVAEVIRTKIGKTYVIQEGFGPETGPRFYAIFEYLPGEDRYTWVETRISPREAAQSGKVFAQFHNAVSNFSPQGRRAEPAILELLPSLDELLTNWTTHSKQTTFDRVLMENATIIHLEIHQVLDQLPILIHELPRLVVHCDYHPGNLKFQDESVVGLFDFDWSKVDYRCFDLGLAIFYFFSGWEAGENGVFRMKTCRAFVNAYQEECRRLGCVSPVTPSEIEALPCMVRAGNLYVLNWTLLDFMHKNVDIDEYLAYLVHAIETIRWLAQPANMGSLRQILTELSE